eukprot:gb/GFBE01023663.1/.p1 GENE.gb/GFBE01023663.1/~~gb/GFBE01023663.1/.p1  ORF type:complete len:312 (+),score=62.87 gb/GFBE01023663.1/:1-936(+)
MAAWLIALLVIGILAVIVWAAVFSASKKPAKKQKLEDSVDEVGPLSEESWVPTLNVKDWKQAHELPGCPWNFDGCGSLDDVLSCIWKAPVPKELQVGFDALQKRVKNISVAHIILTSREAHFCVVYSLITGAELFGGAPAEHTVGVELIGEPEEDSGLRRRRGASSTSSGWAKSTSDTPLPCLMPFFRIHDGFGAVMSRKHLPLLLESPADTVHGSSFYVYPRRGLEPLALRPSLLKVGRVDKTCCLCVDRRSQDNPGVVYAEKNGTLTEDDETPLEFIADTVSNISGQRVVPAPYEGGPSIFGSGTTETN